MGIRYVDMVGDDTSPTGLVGLGELDRESEPGSADVTDEVIRDDVLVGVHEA